MAAVCCGKLRLTRSLAVRALFFLSLSLSLLCYPFLMKVTEQVLRSDSRIERLLKNPIWRPAAEAAMAFYLQGTDCPIASWQRSSTWAQVKMVWEEQSKK